MEEFLIKRGSSKIELDKLLLELRKLDDKAVIQLFDSDAIKGRAHLVGAYTNAVIAFKNGTNRSKNKAMEMLLFAGMTDQIDVALKRIGAKDRNNFILFCSNSKLLPKLAKLMKLNDFKSISNRRRDLQVLQSMALSRLE